MLCLHYAHIYIDEHKFYAGFPCVFEKWDEAKVLTELIRRLDKTNLLIAKFPALVQVLSQQGYPLVNVYIAIENGDL